VGYEDGILIDPSFLGLNRWFPQPALSDSLFNDSPTTRTKLTWPHRLLKRGSRAEEFAGSTQVEFARFIRTRDHDSFDLRSLTLL
jgi:hypothetical protein